MKRFTEQFNKHARKIKLTASERADLRDRLTAYMEYHPLPQGMRAPVAPAAEVGIASQPFVSLKVNWFYVRNAAMAFSVFLMIAVPVAAEYTKPGDVLYPVKIRFNEEVRSSLTLDPYEKIEWETERIERRISEARLLAQAGELTDEREDAVVAAVKEHSDAAKAQIAVLRETDADDAAIAEITFATALEVQSEVLGKTVAVATQQESTDSAVAAATPVAGSKLAQAVADETSAANASQAAVTPSLPKLMARVETDTTAAYELFESVQKHASVAEVDDIERRLEDISRKVAAVTSDAHADTTTAVTATATMVATTTSSSTAAATSTATSTESVATTNSAAEAAPAPIVLSNDESIVVLRGVLADLKKLMTFMTDIDVRSSVSVEELVPLTPTNEEQVATVQARLATVQQFLDTAAQTDYAAAPAAEKIDAGVTSVETLRAEIEAALETANLPVALEQSQRALDYVEDLTKLLAVTQTDSDAPAVPPVTEPATSTATDTESVTE